MKKKPISFKNINLKQPTFYAIWIQTKHFIITHDLSKTQKGRACFKQTRETGKKKQYNSVI
jgi:hypothetical protein